ncbi:MAG: Flp pilus assembly protein CpaB [Planctomycetota bacterium]|nr:Flp pilus assembly protein CpaB [Planctomycetota bacterium]
MQTRTLLVIVFAVLFGVIAALGALFKQTADSPIEMVSIAVASVDIGRGVTLTTDQVAIKQWPKETAPQDGIADIDKVIGRTNIVALAKNEPIVNAKLGIEGSGPGLLSMIKPGMRAVSIQTPNIATGVAGFVLPGNKVDVILTITPNGADDGSGGGTTVTVLQNVEVLAVDQKIEAPSDHKMDPKELRSVTLMVTPQDVQKLDLSHNKGVMRLSLRNPLDDSITPVPKTTLKQLRTGKYDQTPENEEADKNAQKKLRRTRATPVQIVTFRGPEAGVVTLGGRRRVAVPAPAEEVTEEESLVAASNEAGQ